MATTYDGERIDFDDLRSDVRGSVVDPDDEEYDDARRVWNARYDRYPAGIVQVSGVADVRAAVRFAGERELPIAVRGGGHSYAGHGTGDDCLVIDCAAMDAVHVDPDANTVRVGPGATWGDVDHETQAFGLATTGATVSSVGVAGYTLGGGTGHLVRAFGTAADNLIAADVVTADGELVHASADEHADLFWALRGGGANFGVVTSFTFDLHEVGPEVLGGQIVHPFENAREVMTAYRDYMRDAPRAVNCYPFVIRIPPLEVFPEETHGEMALDLVVSHAGDIAQAEDDLAPLRAVGDPILDGVVPQPYVALQQAFDDLGAAGNRWYSKAQYLTELSDDAIDTFLDAVDPLRGEFTSVYLEPMGGAVADVDPTATAFPHRDVAYSVHALTGWSDPEDDEELIVWTEDLHQRMSAYSPGGVYVNLLSDEEADRVPEAYGQNLDRLAELKAQYDPENRFRVNQNVEPEE